MSAELARCASTFMAAWKPAADSPLAKFTGDRRLVLITGHRRENFGKGFERICLALAELGQRFPVTVHQHRMVQQYQKNDRFTS